MDKRNSKSSANFSNETPTVTAPGKYDPIDANSGVKDAMGELKTGKPNKPGSTECGTDFDTGR